MQVTNGDVKATASVVEVMRQSSPRYIYIIPGHTIYLHAVTGKQKGDNSKIIVLR